MRLDEVDKGQILPLRIVPVDKRPGSLRLSTNWIPPAHYPTAQSPFRHAQVMGRFSHRVRRRQAGVVSFVASFSDLEGHSSLKHYQPVVSSTRLLPTVGAGVWTPVGSQSGLRNYWVWT